MIESSKKPLTTYHFPAVHEHVIHHEGITVHLTLDNRAFVHGFSKVQWTIKHLQGAIYKNRLLFIIEREREHHETNSVRLLAYDVWIGF